MSKDEEEEREEALAEVADPMFLMHRGDADADGDIEVDDGTGGHIADSYISWIHYQYCLRLIVITWKSLLLGDLVGHERIEHIIMKGKEPKSFVSEVLGGGPKVKTETSR